MKRSRHVLNIVAAAGLAGLLSCSDGTAPALADCGEIFGQFAGRATGAATDSLRGCGYYAYNSIDGFAMVLSNGGPVGEPMVKLFADAVPLGSRSVDAALRGAVFIGAETYALRSGSYTAALRAGNWERKQLVGSLDVIAVNGVGDTVRVFGAFSSGCVGKSETPTPGDKPRKPPPECEVQAAGARSAM